MLKIGNEDVKNYNDQGFVVSKNYLSDELISKITYSYDKFIENNSNLTLEEMSSPHLRGGVGMKHKVDESLSNSFCCF